MMKNKMMRAASVLLVAVLLSTCAISGTFAKYVTSATGTDNARVAKWGITMTNNSSDTFVATYKNGQLETSVNGVENSAAKDVVAPGTTSTVTYEVNGAPETDYVISFDYSGVKEVFLKAGTVFTYTNADANGTPADNAVYDAGMSTTSTTITADYLPIKYQVVMTTKLGTVAYSTTVSPEANKYVESDSDANDNNGNDTYTYPVVGKLEDALKQLQATTVTFDTNETCDVEVTITWNWAFENTATPNGNSAAITDDDHIVDAYDTILGDLIVPNGDLQAKKANDSAAVNGATDYANADYNLTVEYTLKMTATQLD